MDFYLNKNQETELHVSSIDHSKSFQCFLGRNNKNPILVGDALASPILLKFDSLKNLGMCYEFKSILRNLLLCTWLSFKWSIVSKMDQHNASHFCQRHPFVANSTQ